MIVLQQFTNHRRDIVGRGRRANGLQIAAGGEGAAFALDHQHPYRVIGLDLGAELLELLRDRQVDRVEGRGPVQRNGRDRTFDPEQSGVGRVDMVGAFMDADSCQAFKSQKGTGDNPAEVCNTSACSRVWRCTSRLTPRECPSFGIRPRAPRSWMRQQATDISREQTTWVFPVPS